MARFFHVSVEEFLARCTAEGFSPLDVMTLRAEIGDRYDRAKRPTPPESASTTAPDTPAAIRRTGSSQRFPAIKPEDDPDED